MKPCYQDEWVTQYCDDALGVLLELESDSIDLLCTDPPYGIGFMGKDWDKALPDKRIWAECLRVLKPGAFAFVMSIPRSDCLSRMIISLEDAGFRVDFSPIYWAYASGFPKAQNIGKAVDKRLGISEVEYREPFGREGRSKVPTGSSFESPKLSNPLGDGRIGYHKASSPQAKALDGSYGGFQPKPAVEVIIVCMKPLSEKTFVDQALTNQKGITWLDDGRIPYESEGDTREGTGRKPVYGMSNWTGDRQGFTSNGKGRFPANLLVSDDVLNDGVRRRSQPTFNNVGDFKFLGNKGKQKFINTNVGSGTHYEYSFSRYFDLDKWAQKTFPFLIVPKASKSEKNKGLGEYDAKKQARGGGGMGQDPTKPNAFGSVKARMNNNHPTVKPLKLMSYLITLGSRQGDTILDPFGGSGTTALASKLLGRKCIISEIKEKYCEISANRCRQMVMELR